MRGGSHVATYIMLFRFTPQGIQNIKESPARVKAAKKALEDMGAKVKEFYLLMGQYDTAFIVEAPDDETIATAALAVGSLGNVSTETIGAFTEEEFRKMVAALP
jgi:uncharacterized protein with GYD domain